MQRRTDPAIVVVLFGLLAACGGSSKMPTGPSPEYEDPPRPSWMGDGGAANGSPPAPAAAPPATIDPAPGAAAPGAAPAVPGSGTPASTPSTPSPAGSTRPAGGFLDGRNRS